MVEAFKIVKKKICIKYGYIYKKSKTYRIAIHIDQVDRYRDSIVSEGH